MNHPKIETRNSKRTRRGVAAFTAIVLVGVAGVAGAAMMAYAPGPAGGSTAALPAEAWDPLLGWASAPGAAPVAPGAPGEPAGPGADSAVACRKETHPTAGTIDACVGAYAKDVVTTTAQNTYQSCGGGSVVTSRNTRDTLTTNAPVDATYTAYQGNRVHADATQVSGPRDASNSFSYHCAIWNGYAWGSGSDSIRETGKRTHVRANQAGPAGLPWTFVSLYQQNTTETASYNSYAGFCQSGYGCGWGATNGNYARTNRDTVAAASLPGASAALTQYDNSFRRTENSYGCDPVRCSGSTVVNEHRYQSTAVGATLGSTPVTPGSSGVRVGQDNVTSKSCYNTYCGTYAYRATAVSASTSSVPGAVSPHSVWVGQENMNNGGCKTRATVDGVNYMPYVPVPADCALEAPDVPRIPDVDFPAPGQVPAPGGVPLPPLPPMPPLPPLPQL